jgi:hypothetical protein
MITADPEESAVIMHDVYALTCNYSVIMQGLYTLDPRPTERGSSACTRHSCR